MLCVPIHIKLMAKEEKKKEIHCRDSCYTEDKRMWPKPEQKNPTSKPTNASLNRPSRGKCCETVTVWLGLEKDCSLG